MSARDDDVGGINALRVAGSGNIINVDA